MSIRFHAREYQQWSRRSFMVRAVRAMVRSGGIPASYRTRVRASFERLRQEDLRLRSLVG